VLLTFSIALFAPGRIVRLIAHSHPYGSVAWAQDTAYTDEGADVSPEPAVAPPDLNGIWAGPIDDIDFGTSTFTIDIQQKHSKLTGDWSTTAGGGGTFTGKVKSDGVSLTFKFKQKHSKCKVAAEGTLVNPSEITGNYTSKKCGGASSGAFDLTLTGPV